MKYAYSLAFLFFASLKITAQVVAANDSVATAAGNTDMVFYNLQSGQKTSASNIDWHLALSVRPSLFPLNTLQGTSLRINEALGVNAYQIPGFNADSFYTVVDAADYLSWNQLHDADSMLDKGALNDGLNIQFYNYGWGVYNGPPNHDVVGKKVYLFVMPDGSKKKFIVDQLDRDTAWVVKYANLDNSDLQTIRVSKNTYANKNFVYLNILDNMVHDKEPLSNEWDLQFLKYSAMDVMADTTLNVVGVWTNKGETVAEAAPVNAALIDNAGAVPFANNMNTIGWDWKQYDYLNHTCILRDSLAYFVKTNSGIVFKLVFTGYSDLGAGIISFYKQEYITAIAEPEKQLSLDVFPNPSSSVLNIVTGSANEIEIKVTDLSGRVLNSTKTSSPLVQLNTTEMASGVYLLSVTSGNAAGKRKFVVAH